MDISTMGPKELKLQGYPPHDSWTKWGKAGDQHINCVSKLRWYGHKLRASWFLCFFETDFTKNKKWSTTDTTAGHFNGTVKPRN